MLDMTNSKREASMSEVSIIGIDLAKQVFQLHGACSDGSVVFRKRLSRSQVLTFLEKQPRCVVALEACATAHDWGRRIGTLGHDVMLIPPIYVKPFVKRQKNDMADAQAIAEAAARPTMTRVSVKTKDQQARAMLFRTRDLLVRQRRQLINALRGHLAEYGVVAPRAKANLRRLEQALAEPDSELPGMVVEIGQT
jgi:transposase